MEKKIIIVGATSGIGRRMAELYAAKGWRVGITGRRQGLLNELQQQHPEQLAIAGFDITGNENIAQLETLVKKMGGLNLLVISAGTGESSADLQWKIDKTIVDTNVNGFVEIANWGFNYFAKQGYGQLAAISSVQANRGSSYSPAYAASKSFKSIYLEGLAIKARRLKKNITVTCIEPGFVNTKLANGGDKMFWVVPVDKAARQIIRAIEKKKRKVYISRRWRIVAKLMKWAPYWLYKRFG